jgi:hypothetical protein
MFCLQHCGKPEKRTKQWKAMEERAIRGMPPHWQSAYYKMSVHELNRQRSSSKPLKAAAGKTGGGTLRYILSSVYMNEALNEQIKQLAEGFQNGSVFSSKAKGSKDDKKTMHIDSTTGLPIKIEFQFCWFRNNFAKLPEPDVIDLLQQINSGIITFDQARIVRVHVFFARGFNAVCLCIKIGACRCMYPCICLSVCLCVQEASRRRAIEEFTPFLEKFVLKLLAEKGYEDVDMDEVYVRV